MKATRSKKERALLMPPATSKDAAGTATPAFVAVWRLCRGHAARVAIRYALPRRDTQDMRVEARSESSDSYAIRRGA